MIGNGKATLGAALVAFVNAVLSVVVNFGANLSAQQETAILTVTNAFVLLLVAANHALGTYYRQDRRNG